MSLELMVSSRVLETNDRHAVVIPFWNLELSRIVRILEKTGLPFYVIVDDDEAYGVSPVAVERSNYRNILRGTKKWRTIQRLDKHKQICFPMLPASTFIAGSRQGQPYSKPHCGFLGYEPSDGPFCGGEELRAYSARVIEE